MASSLEGEIFKSDVLFCVILLNENGTSVSSTLTLRNCHWSTFQSMTLYPVVKRIIGMWFLVEYLVVACHALGHSTEVVVN